MSLLMISCRPETLPRRRPEDRPRESKEPRSRLMLMRRKSNPLSFKTSTKRVPWPRWPMLTTSTSVSEPLLMTMMFLLEEAEADEVAEVEEEVAETETDLKRVETEVAEDRMPSMP